MLITALCTGCLAVNSYEGRLKVAFLPQTETNHCGDTCLTMALTYFSVPFDRETVKSKAYIPAVSGSTPELLADTAESYGLKADIRLLTLDDIKTALFKSQIPILFLPPAAGEMVGHFVLVTAVDSKSRRIRAHDGTHANHALRLTNETYLTLLLSKDSEPNIESKL